MILIESSSSFHAVSEVHLQLQYSLLFVHKTKLFSYSSSPCKLAFPVLRGYVLTCGFVCPHSLLFNLDDAMHVTSHHLPHFSRAKLFKITGRSLGTRLHVHVLSLSLSLSLSHIHTHTHTTCTQHAHVQYIPEGEANQ